MPLSPEQVVEQQISAYNAHDIEAFMATYSPTIQTIDFPTNRVFEDGADAVRAIFQKYFEKGRPHVEISQRITKGNIVIDHELGHDLKRGDWQAVAIYEVKDELIQRVWFLLR